VGVAEDARDRAAARAQVQRGAAGAQALGRAAGEQLGLEAWDVDAGVDADAQPAEVGAAGDPGERLAGQPAGDQRLEPLLVAAGGVAQLAGLLAGGDEARGGQAVGELVQLRPPSAARRPRRPRRSRRP
jgi:hypothetical protein